MRRARAASEDEEQPAPRRRHVAPAAAAEATAAAAAAVGLGVAEQQQQLHQQPGVQPDHADGGDGESQQEDEEEEGDYDEDEEPESEEGEAEEPDSENEFEDGEDAEDDNDGYYHHHGDDAGLFTIPGAGDYDIVVGAPVGAPARASGATPQVNPATDTQIAPGVYARQELDGCHCLFGSPLRNIPKMLSKVFQMQQQRGQLLWKSSVALSDLEWKYIKDALGHERIQPLLQRGERVLKPLPESGFPQRLRPKDGSGDPLRGPLVSRNSGKPWNVGRQYFSSFKNGDFSGFMWADGVGAMEAEAQGSFNEYMDDVGGLYGMF